MPSKELIPPVSREDRACHGTWGTWGSLDFGQEAERSKGWGDMGKPRPEPSLGGMASQGRGDILELASMNDSSRLWVLDWSLVACFLALG